MYFFKNLSMNLKKKREKVYVNTVTAEKSQLTYIKLEPGEETNHSHSNEQLGYIIKEQAEIKIGNEIRICGPGDAYFIPSNIIHGFKVINNQNVEYIEIFSPPKEENKL